ncbi:class I SAM-dependent methyltransferase [Marmoricola sp. RAF53]|uniref:class I SAM-dependent methyltransferase n=1 Tax=Marmoricola sp. RAF53 TaxID=3233059 RepID=UPI003F98513A
MNSRLRAAVRPVARPIVVAANKPFATRRANAALKSAARPVRLEIGGNDPREGWVVTNVGPFARNYLDATAAWPLEDGSVELVFADNVVEHIPLEGVRAMLREAYRCLQPGGTVRLCTPDMRKHVDLYLKGRESLDGPEAGFYKGIGLTVEHPVDLLRIPVASFEHWMGYMFDFETLKQELEAIGFHSVVEKELGFSDVDGLSGLDLREGEEGTQMSVEATR